jgi:O-antigen/teichoic acid export membrane protein
MLIGLLVRAFQTAWGPFSLSLYKQPDSGLTFNWVFKLFAFCACIAVLFITLVAQPLIHFLASERYSGAVIVVFPLVMGLAIQAISWISEIGIGISKKSYLSLYSYFAALGFTMGGILFLVPVFGLLGIGLAVLLGHVVKAFIASWLSQKAYRLPWQYRPVLVIVFLTLSAGLSFTWVSSSLSLLAGNFLLLTCIVLLLFVGWFGLLNQSERQQIIMVLRHRLSFSG